MASTASSRMACSPCRAKVVVLVGGRLVGGQPAADELGAQPGGDECVALEVGGERLVDHRPDLVGPGQQRPAEGDPARAALHALIVPAVARRTLTVPPVRVSLDHRFHARAHRQDRRPT